MHKIMPVVLSYLLVLLGGCEPNAKIIDVPPKTPVSEIESCNFRAKLLLPKGKLTEKSKTRVSALMLKTLNKFINSAEFGTVTFVNPGIASAGYMYFDLQEPCLESSRKVDDFIETYNSYARWSGVLKIKLGDPESISSPTP